jgi:hypothetical protein
MGVRAVPAHRMQHVGRHTRSDMRPAANGQRTQERASLHVPAVAHAGHSSSAAAAAARRVGHPSIAPSAGSTRTACRFTRSSPRVMCDQRKLTASSRQGQRGAWVLGEGARRGGSRHQVQLITAAAPHARATAPMPPRRSGPSGASVQSAVNAACTALQARTHATFVMCGKGVQVEGLRPADIDADWLLTSDHMLLDKKACACVRGRFARSVLTERRAPISAAPVAARERAAHTRCSAHGTLREQRLRATRVGARVPCSAATHVRHLTAFCVLRSCQHAGAFACVFHR